MPAKRDEIKETVFAELNNLLDILDHIHGISVRESAELISVALVRAVALATASECAIKEQARIFERNTADKARSESEGRNTETIKRVKEARERHKKGK